MSTSINTQSDLFSVLNNEQNSSTGPWANNRTNAYLEEDTILTTNSWGNLGVYLCNEQCSPFAAPYKG